MSLNELKLSKYSQSIESGNVTDRAEGLKFAIQTCAVCIFVWGKVATNNTKYATAKNLCNQFAINDFGHAHFVFFPRSFWGKSCVYYTVVGKSGDSASGK